MTDTTLNLDDLLAKAEAATNWERDGRFNQIFSPQTCIALIAAARERDRLRERNVALEELLVCYRIGRRPTEKLYRKLDKTKQALKEQDGKEA